MIIQDRNMKSNLSEINTINTSYYYLFNLQKRIYKASKEGHLSLVYSLQKLLLSLRSIKLLARDTVKQKITNLNKKDNNTINKISSLDITKQTIYWCLEAEWIPKIHYATQQQVPRCTNKITNLLLESFLLNNNVKLSTLNYKNLINKLQPLKVIQINIQNLLKQEHFTNYTNHQTARVNICILQADYLYHLLVLITINGNHWHYFRQSKITMQKLTNSILFFKSLIFDRNIYTKKKIRNEVLINLTAFSESIGYFCHNGTVSYFSTYQIKAIDAIYYHDNSRLERFCNESISLISVMNEELQKNIKGFLFHKDHLGRLRINNNLKVRCMTENVTFLVRKFSRYYIISKEMKDLSKVVKIITDMCYYWLKKKYKRPQKFKVEMALCLLKVKLDNITKLSNW